MENIQKLTQLRTDMEIHFQDGITNIELNAGHWMHDILDAAGFTPAEREQILGPNYNQAA